ncbi:MAG: hypothetical protein ACHQQQ_11760 [Bacteroidota bacterium]
MPKKTLKANIINQGVSDHLLTGAAKAAAEKAITGKVQVTVYNYPGRPFQVIDLGGGRLAWGVGGGSGGVSYGGDPSLIAKTK